MRRALAAWVGLALSATTGQAQPTGEPVQADAWFTDYTFRDHEKLDKLKLHYATLGTPHRNAHGDIDDAILVLHWTGADSRALLSPVYTQALFASGRPLDATRYYLISSIP